VEAAFAAHDNATLEKYGRFLEPILRTMLAKEPNRSQARRLGEYLNAVYAAQIRQAHPESEPQ